jgi:chromosome segregation protein
VGEPGFPPRQDVRRGRHADGRVHLRSIRLRGFKSFPDTVEIRLEPGVAVVVGPNGSGKSNVADGILWASGSLSPTELRAEKPDDVLFAGSADRPPARYCEVELNLDNSDGGFSELPYADVAIARRLHRGGEGQYVVNGTTVRRIDLVELLADVGLGGGISVIGQGRVEAILASTPRERRDLVEEAAGVGRFKRRRHRAELKLARVSADVARARDLEEEVRKRLRPLALQATAAERAEKLGKQIQALQARIAELGLVELEGRLAGGEERRAAAAHRRKRAEDALEELLAERARAEDELADAAGRREDATAALYRLRSAGERVTLRKESAESQSDALRSLLAVPADEDARTRAALEREALEAAREAQQSVLDRESLDEQARVAAERLEALDRSLAEREGLPPAARALAEDGEPLALGLLEVDEGYERAVAAALGSDSAALLASSPADALALVERARREGLGSVTVLVPSNSLLQSPVAPLPGAEWLAQRVRAKPGGEEVAGLLADAWVVPPERLGEATHGVAVTKDGRRFEPGRGAAAFVGAAAEAIQLELEARRRSLAAYAHELEHRREEAERTAEQAARRDAEARAALERLGPGRATPTNPALARNVLRAAERLSDTLIAADRAADRLEPPLRARADAGAGRVAELGEELRRLGAREAEARGAAAEAAQALGAIEVELARVEAEAQEARRRLEAAGAEPAEGEDRDELEAKVERLERRRVTLGQVNPLAREEYEREKERLAELSEQREDLERSLDELERLRADLTETVERRFAETFAAVREFFEEVAQTLFPGGEGRLRLTEPEAGEDDDAEPGVEVELRPAGKRITRLSLLSGGEKALGAIAFLFSLFLARPAPFYLLDEVEAALDDRNISRFVELLRRYAGRAQFIVVTHQKGTMEAADTLYGVTMGQDGVTQIVSRRVPREEPLAATA